METGLGSIQRVKNTAELVADALRSAIMQGKLKSGQSLKQDEIARQYDVSKIPVREALVQLQAEGLVKLNPSRGAIVSKLSFAEVEEIYTMRLVLEPLALRRAIPNLTAADFIAAEYILDRIDNEDDLSRWAELNWEFHETLYMPSGLSRVIQTTRELHNNVARFLIFNYLTQNQLVKSQAQHREILELSRKGDADAACALLEDHLGDPVAMFARQLNGKAGDISPL